jgi:hypothetical protein
MSQDRIAIFEKWATLDEMRETLYGTKVCQMLSSFRSTHYAVNKNYQELSLVIARYESDQTFWSTLKRNDRIVFFREFSRLLHNYLSSAFSLICHNMRFRNNYPRISEEYKQKLDDLLKNDCCPFMRGLRNITQHIELPDLVAHFSREGINQPVKQSIVLKKENLLLRGKDFPHAIRDGFERYIRANKEIDLKIALSRYQCLLEDFHNWFYHRIKQLYARELKEYATISKEIRKLQLELSPKTKRTSQ